MKPLLMKFLPFILITTFAVIAISFIINTFKIHSFKPITIDKANSNLTSAGDLTGTWSGVATFKNTENPSYYCTFSGNLTLKLTQVNNQVKGQFIYVISKSVPFGEGTQCSMDTDTYQISANVTGSRIENLTADYYGLFTGSFTTDTVTLNQSKTTSLKLISPINLLRK